MLAWPQNGAIGVQQTGLTLNWDPVLPPNGAPLPDWKQPWNYDVQLWYEDGQGTPVYVVNATTPENGNTGSEETDSFYNVAVTLPRNTVHYWRVRPRNPLGPHLWSDTWSFTTPSIGNPNEIPTLVSPGDGTLQLVPIAKGIVYLLLRALQDDVPDNILAGAEPCRALSITEQWHAPLLAGLCPIPTVMPGDTVWWHPDIVHAVEAKHQGTGYSNVIYIGAAPYCAKNARYLSLQKQAFLILCHKR